MIKRKFRNIWIFMIILGPGLLSAMAGNDAGGTATYSIAGARYGYSMLWILLLVAVSLIVIQEMCARMGVVTGKGLSDLIREEFGVRWTLFAMAILLIANVAVTISEFAGIAASLEIFHVSRYISVPIVAFFIWWLILKGSYSFVEKIFFGIAFVYVSYVFSGFMAKPEWKDVFLNTVIPHFRFDRDFIHLAIAMIGTTVTPWMQFYLQSSVVEKGTKRKNYRYQKWDIIVGTIVAVFIAFFIIIACGATLHQQGIVINQASDAALALKPIAGNYAAALFAIGLFASSFLGACILPLSSSYAICEAFGFENGISKRISEAPVFFALYTLLILVGACVVLIPNLNLIHVMVFSQTMNGILLPVILVFMLRLVNDKRLMGSYVNSKFNNIVTVVTAVVLIILSGSLFVSVFM
ncbi:MAG: Nramp family divalent metal transporter [Candidatus Saganbacteria bacterium]|nr:Nramp family divalent metal transporter [Candidatus Saganbacteria bacterium]